MGVRRAQGSGEEQHATADAVWAQLPAPLMLLVHGSPSRAGVGDIFLRALADGAAPGQLVRYSTVYGHGDRSEQQWMSHGCFTTPIYRSRSVLGPWLAYWANCQRGGQIADEVDRVASSHDVCAVWAVLNRPVIISLVYALMRRHGVPVLAHVWDTPDSLRARMYLDPISAHRVMTQFGAVLKGALAVAVASEPMRQAYLRRYGVDSVPIIHGFARHEWRDEAMGVGSDECRLAFAGSLYARREWNALAQALHQTGYVLDGHRIALHHIGTFPRLGARRPPTLVTHGRNSVGDTLALLRTMSLAYLPYWFDSRHAHAAMTSFPTKLSAYLAAGLPVLYHGPRGTAPDELMSRYPFGVACYSRKATDILDGLSRILSDNATVLRMRQARRAVLEEELGLHVMRHRFEQLLASVSGAPRGRPCGSGPERQHGSGAGHSAIGTGASGQSSNPQARVEQSSFRTIG